MSAIPNRDNILRFLEDNKDRVYITHQVQREYLRHRLEFIDKYKNKLTTSASAFRTSLKAFEFKAADKVNEILTAIVKEEFVDSMPQSQQMVEKVKNDLQEFDVLSEHYKEIKTELAKIKETFEKEYGELYKKASIEFDDYILNKISETHIMEPLSDEEMNFTKTLYNQMLERYNDTKSEGAEYLRFPGSGENQDLDKKLEPWGDLLIYHEMLSFMAKEHKDVLFLTYDKSKQDWMKKSGEQYSYYVVDAFCNTNQTLIIRKADDFFTGSFNSSHQDVIDEDSVGVTTSSYIQNTESINATHQLKFNNISKEEFVSQLKNLIIKNGESADVHISKSYFIYVVLGKQGYRYSHSFQMLDQLRGKKVEEYDFNDGEYEYKCLRLIEQPVVEEPMVE